MYRFKNFSESGNKAITAAISIAGKMGHITVGTEHILMGILSCGKSDASDLLGENSVSFACVYNVAVNVLGTGSPTAVTGDDMSRNALSVLKHSYSTALKNGRTQAGTSEILYGIVENHTCMANHMLMTLVERYEDFCTKAEKRCHGTVTAATLSDAPKLKTLEKYSRNLVAAAKSKPFDPCIGREKETARIMEILLRRQKNNPCLVGLAGVGKTAIVEGLANMIAAGKVPRGMKNKKIYDLDIAYLLAGTKYRGDFEERIKAVVEEASGDRDIILFIDEVHLIAGAGGAEGAIDAANLLKPALARGQIQVIGATTRDEYAKNIEKDSALERRFSVVNITEPDAEQTRQILYGIKEKYMAFHRLDILDSAVEKSVELSVKYIHHRFLPDKAIDLLDQSCAAVKMDGGTVVDGDAVGRIISRNTGIPAEKILAGERDRFIRLERQLTERISGQPYAAAEMARCIRKWRAGLKDESSPIASFMFAGPTGVGKTYSCTVLAQLLFDRTDSVIRVDCTEYSEKNDITKLIGSPPGYVGYDEGGRLEKEMGSTPHCVILFDEIEKAHPDLHNLLLQAMDSGFITTARGKKISFRNSIIVMTSNTGAALFTNKNRFLGFSGREKTENLNEQIKNELKKHFSREFIARLDSIVPFTPLDEESISRIITKELDNIARKLKRQGIIMEYDKTAVEYIRGKNPSSEYGARDIKRIAGQETENLIVNMILEREIVPGSTLFLCADDKMKIKICEKV